MKLTQEQLEHVLFLCETIRQDRKRGLMPDAIQCLMYIVKSLPQVDLPDESARRLLNLVQEIEGALIAENERLQEIRSNMNHPNRRNPFGK